VFWSFVGTQVSLFEFYLGEGWHSRRKTDFLSDPANETAFPKNWSNFNVFCPEVVVGFSAATSEFGLLFAMLDEIFNQAAEKSESNLTVNYFYCE
jgi:hypothetical protein